MPPLRIREEARRPKAEGSHELPRRVGLCTERRGRGILRTSPLWNSRKFSLRDAGARGYRSPPPREFEPQGTHKERTEGDRAVWRRVVQDQNEA